MNKVIRTIRRAIETLKPMKEHEPHLLMSNLSKEDTGLPFVVWTYIKNPNQHYKPRIKFANNYSDCLLPKALVSVSISDNPQILSKRTKIQISKEDFKKLRLWIIGNQEALMQVWNAEISSIEFIRKMKHLNELVSLSETASINLKDDSKSPFDYRKYKVDILNKEGNKEPHFHVISNSEGFDIRIKISDGELLSVKKFGRRKITDSFKDIVKLAKQWLTLPSTTANKKFTNQEFAYILFYIMNPDSPFNK